MNPTETDQSPAQRLCPSASQSAPEGVDTTAAQGDSHPPGQPPALTPGQPPAQTPGQTPALTPGQQLARGVCRHLAGHGYAVIEEFVPDRGLRVDVMALGPKGELWVVECKSSRADFMSDAKWQGYLPWCDRYFWAVDADFPTDLLPEDTGLIIADGYDAEILRIGPEQKLPAARRRKLVQKFAVHAARRLQSLRDPGAGLAWR